MPTVRERMSTAGGGGSFSDALVRLHDCPTFEHLMEAYTNADLANRIGLETALAKTDILKIWDPKTSAYTSETINLNQVHQMWLKMRGAGDLVGPLEEVFGKLRDLDAEAA